jgi:hypothetical protein
MSSKTFIVSRLLTLREALPIADPLTAGYLVPGEFMGLFKTRLSPEEVLCRVIERAERQVIDSFRLEERYLLRGEKKRPWAWKTRRPFRGKIDRETPTFSEKLGLAEEVAVEVTARLGPPWERAETGRPPIYDPVKLGAALLVKGEGSFNDLAAELRNVGYDVTIKEIGGTPCPSELHYAFSKTKSEWFEEALARLDERSAEPLEKFEEPLDLFTVDGSALPGERLEERTIALERRLIREIYSYTALTRLPTNTVRGLAGHTNRIKPFMPLLSPGSLLLADSEFDVEDNYRLAGWHGIDLQVRQKKGDVRRSFRKKARRGFDRRKYGKRKLGERPFGNVEVRGYRCYYRKEGHRYKGALLVGCEHNVRAYFRNRAWSGQFRVLDVSYGKPPPVSHSMALEVV